MMKAVVSFTYEKDLWAIGLRKWSANSEIRTVQLLDPLQIGRNYGKVENGLWSFGRP